MHFEAYGKERKMDMLVRGKRALVCGGTSGIGFAIARELLNEGATVVLVGRDATKGIAAARSLGLPDQAVISCDLSSRPSIDATLKPFIEQYPIDILLNNTGGPAVGKPLEITLDAWEQGYRSLVESTLHLTGLVAPHMSKKNWGRVLTITSSSSREVIQNLPVSSTFRSALRALTKELALVHGGDGILFNNILPGLTRTERLKDLEHESPDTMRIRAQGIAVKRLAEPEEVARAAVFLLSGANTYITGTEILVDGGLTRAL